MTKNNTPQLQLEKFKKIVINLYNNDNLACHYLSKSLIFKAIKLRYFSKKDPLYNDENLLLYPSATKQFQQAIKNGHSLKSCEKDLNFLKKEFNKFFEALKYKRILLVRNPGRFEDYFICPDILFTENKEANCQSTGIINAGKNNVFDNCVITGFDKGIENKGDNAKIKNTKIENKISKQKWYENLWFKTIIGILSGLIVGFLLYKFGWTK